jgi:Xaa-Pro dipeptidase
MTISTTAMRDLQAFMLDRRIDAWVLWDFRGSNPIAAQLFPSPSGKRWTTRRFAIIIPARGEPTALVHAIDATQFDKDPIRKQIFLSWQELRANLAELLTGAARVAMEYSPGGQLPAVSFVDAGAIELIRGLGMEVVSSADLIQVSVARWSEAAQADHRAVSAKVTAIKDDAFAMISSALKANQPITELDVQRRILGAFEREKLQTDGEPVVAVNAHAGDPHFEVDKHNPASIKRGDWVLIDLWARTPGEQHIFSDITWVGACGSEALIPERMKVYNAVKAARNASLKLAQDSWKANQPVQGWQLDDAARRELITPGYEKFIRHRTGHSLSPGPKVHGVGMNLDNLETRDTRTMIPAIGYTIEPGLYLPTFGVRLEINVFVDPTKGPVVTSCLQDDVIVMG